MAGFDGGGFESAVFITFSGNCRTALIHYQTCFGGTLQFETFDDELDGYMEKPVVKGTLAADGIIIHGSDLVHDEGRTLGNYVSIFLRCQNASKRQALIDKLKSDKMHSLTSDRQDLVLIEITDLFDVRWVLGV